MNTDMKHGKFLFLRWCRKNVRWCRKIAMVEKKYDGAGKMPRAWYSQCNEEETPYTKELKFESWAAATTKHHLIKLICTCIHICTK